MGNKIVIKWWFYEILRFDNVVFATLTGLSKFYKRGDLMAGELNLTIEQGSTFYRKLEIKDSDDVAIDLTDYSARMQIRTTYDGEIIASSIGVSPIISIDITPLTGIIEITISATDTATLTNSKVIYDLEIESATGFVTRLLQGDVTISKEVTK